MADVTFLDGLATISGKIGNTIFRKTPSGKTIAYQQRHYRQSPPTEKELQQRKRFAIAARIVRSVLSHPEMRKTLQNIYKRINKNQRSKTLHGFVFAEVMNMLKEIEI